jgi:hypothetical protein
MSHSLKLNVAVVLTALGGEAMGKDYSVGYGKPPSKHQFEKGKSGNPRGRPRKRPRYAPDEPLDFKRSLIAELQSKITIVENGKKKQITKMEAINKVLVVRAAQGDKTAMRQLLPFVQALPEELFVDRGNEVYEYWMARVRKEATEQFLAEVERIKSAHPEWVQRGNKST